MALLCVVSTTHFYISTEFQRKIEDDMKVNDEGVSLLYNMVSKLYNNLPILHVKSGLFFLDSLIAKLKFSGKGYSLIEFLSKDFESSNKPIIFS